MKPIIVPPHTILTDQDRHDSDPANAKFTVLHEGSRHLSENVSRLGADESVILEALAYTQRG